MPEPTVSVVLTNHNGEKFVRAAVESVLAQTYTDWEMILVDDCSTDDSPRILKSYENDRIRFVQTPYNAQVSAAHNLGNSLCRGRYIAAIDNDDVWMPDKLEKQAAWMEAHPETGACFTHLSLMDENGETLADPGTLSLFDVHNQPREAWLRNLMTTGNHLANDSSLIRRSVMEEIGENDLCLVQLHDYAMWLSILLRYDIHMIEEPLMRYRKIRRGSDRITAVSEENTRRTMFEYAYLISKAIREMDDGLFRKTFQPELKRPDLQTPEAARCEKAILLSGGALHANCRVWAFEMLEEQMRDPETRDLLKDEFGFTWREIHRMTGERILHEDWEERRKSLASRLSRGAGKIAEALPGKLSGSAEKLLNTLRGKLRKE